MISAPALLRATLAVLVGAALAVSGFVAPATADDLLLGPAATARATTEADATEPTTPCEATAASLDQLVTLVSSSGTASVICLGPGAADTGAVVQAQVQRDLVIDINGVTQTERRLALSVAPGSHLQLVDRSLPGGKLLLAGGLGVPVGASLVIWSGHVSAAAASDAGIGGADGEGSGEIVIRGGTVEATNGRTGAGIGGGEEGVSGPITIWDGTVVASASLGAGIGGGYRADAGSIVIHGGTVTAKTFGGGCKVPFCLPTAGAGIGGGDGGGTWTTILITGGVVDARGLNGISTGAGIGGGGHPVQSDPLRPPGTIEISGGTVTARSQMGAGIGGGSGQPGGVVRITGGTVVASAEQPASAVIGAGGLFGSTLAGGSLVIGAGASVTVNSAGPEAGTVFGGGSSAGFDELTVDGTLTVQRGTLSLRTRGDAGANVARVGATGAIVGSGTIRGIGAGLLDNQGSISAAVDTSALTVIGNHYLLTFTGTGGAAPDPLHVFAPTLADGARQTPQVAGIAAWTTDAGWALLSQNLDLAPRITGGTRVAGNAVVALTAVPGAASLTLPASTAVGEVVTPGFERVGTNGAPLAVDHSASYAVTAPGGADVTGTVVTGGTLRFPDGGRYQVTATSAAPGFAHLTASADIDVLEAPSLPASVPPAAVSGESYTFAPAVDGYPAPVLTVDGELPPGLSLVGNAITGVPERAGDFAFTLTATSSEGSAIENYAITVSVGAPAELTISPGDAVVLAGASRSFAVTAVDAYGQSVDVAGDIQLDSSDPSDIVAGDSVTFGDLGDRTVTASLISDPTVNTTAQVQVVTVPLFGAAEPPAAVSGEEYEFVIPVGGSPAPTLTVDGELPPGITLVDGELRGTTTRAGNYPVTVTAQNPGGVVAVDYLLRVEAGAARLLTIALPTGVTARQGESVTFEVSGIDAFGQPTDVSGEVVLNSDVPTDVIDRLTVHFPHASPHRITVALVSNPLIRTTLLVEVRPAGLPSTGTDAAEQFGAALATLLIGLGLVVLGWRSRVNGRRG